MEIFEERCLIPEAGICIGDLFRLIQKVSGDHCRELGFGESVMESLGLMWVIIRHAVELRRWPAPGEELRLCTWPGPTRHGMCPRYYRLLDGNGELLGEGCAIWSIVDRQSRKMQMSPALAIEPLVTGLECRRPAAPGRLPETESADYTVTAAVLDDNGHMNNTRYYDLAEDCLGTRSRPLRRAAAEYLSEAREGDTLHLAWGREGARCCLEGRRDGPAFRMELVYAE